MMTHWTKIRLFELIKGSVFNIVIRIVYQVNCLEKFSLSALNCILVLGFVSFPKNYLILFI